VRVGTPSAAREPLNIMRPNRAPSSPAGTLAPASAPNPDAIAQAGDILGFGLLDQVRPDQSGIVDQMGDLVTGAAISAAAS
jgi:hypothetical protein